MAPILVVEDELSIADAVLYALRADGMAVEHCCSGSRHWSGCAHRRMTWCCSMSACPTSAA